MTTGRSATAYMAAVFGYVQGVHAFHEPEPAFETVMRRVQHDPGAARQFLLYEKLPAIAGDRAQVYVETSHLTCKGFLEPLLELGVSPDVIIHRRPARDVSLSMYAMGTIPGRSDKGLRFYLSPEDPGTLVLANWREMHDYQLCYWYCLEMERRAQRYKEIFTHSGLRVAETTLQGMTTLEGFEKMLDELDLTLKIPAWLTRKRFARNTRKKVNESRETKKQVAIPQNLDELEEKVVDSLDHEARRKLFPEVSRAEV